jgi:hypothetical protein
LLLLLESRPLLGVTTYERTIDNVVAAYWRDYEKHKRQFMPAFLANDILRLWRTLCVNYEAGTQSEPAKKRAKRRLKNYKLKHSRLLTCYSALLYLLTTYLEKKSVPPDDAIAMIRLSPTERLEALLNRDAVKPAHQTIGALLAHYENFLQATNFSEDELIQRFLDAEKRKQYSISESRLGDFMFSAIDQIGQKTPFHRVLLV